MYICECARMCAGPRGAGCQCLESPVLGAFKSGLHLVEEVSATVVLHAAGEDLAAGLRHQQGVFELSRALPVSGHRRPAVGPRLVLPATFTYHGLNGEHVARLHYSNCFVFGIMWHIGSGVEKSMDAVAAVAPHHGEAVGLSVLLNDVT